MNDYQRANIEAQMAAKAQAESMGGALGTAPNTNVYPSYDDARKWLKDTLAFHQQKAQTIEQLLVLMERNPDIEEILNLTRGLL